jgi:hypothetical protein
MPKSTLSASERKSRTTKLYLNEQLAELLDKYLPRAVGGPRSQGQSWTITEQWRRFDTLLKIERRTIRELFTEGERNLMLNNALSTAYTAETIPGAVLADTEDEIDETFADYGVDRAALLTKLRGLNVSQQFALVDWLEEMRAGAN